MSVDIAEHQRAEQKIKSQLEELRRWYQAALNREDRVRQLKREVNEQGGGRVKPRARLERNDPEKYPR